MKLLITTLSALAVSLGANAEDFSIQGVEGKVFYKIKDQGIVKRASALSKDSDGRIQLISGEKTITSVYTKKVTDGAGFKVVIVFPAMQEESSELVDTSAFSEVFPSGGHGSYLVFKGHKLYSGDKKVFWGNFYKVFPHQHGQDGTMATPAQLNVKSVAESVMSGGKHHKFKKIFFGGFFFKK